MLPKFDEYFDDKKKLIEKPVVDSKADFKGSIPKTPPQGGKPYANPGSETNAPKYEKGLGDEGDLMFKMPDLSATSKELPTWPKSARTDEWLRTTKNMTLSELAKATATITVENLQTINKITALINDPTCLQSLIFECQRSGCLADLLSQMLTLKETYTIFAKLLNSEQGKEIQERLTDAINATSLIEGVGPPAHKDEDDLDISSSDIDDTDKSYDAGLDSSDDNNELNNDDDEEDDENLDDSESDESPDSDDSELEGDESPDSDDSNDEDDDPRSDPDHPDHLKKLLGIDQDGTVSNDDDDDDNYQDKQKGSDRQRLKNAMKRHLDF